MDSDQTTKIEIDLSDVNQDWTVDGHGDAFVISPKWNDILLGDGRAAFQPAPLRQVEDVLQRRPAYAAHIDAAVLEEVAVLGGQEGLHHRRRNLVVGDVDSPLVRKLPDQGAVARIDSRRRRRTVVRQFRGVGQVVEQPGRIDGHRHPRQGDAAQQDHARPYEPAFGNLHGLLRRHAPNWCFSPRRPRKARVRMQRPLSLPRSAPI